MLAAARRCFWLLRATGCFCTLLLAAVYWPLLVAAPCWLLWAAVRCWLLAGMFPGTLECFQKAGMFQGFWRFPLDAGKFPDGCWNVSDWVLECFQVDAGMFPA